MIFNFQDFFNNRTKSNQLTENDTCRIAAYFSQNGLCYVSQTPLEIGQRELHHRKPRSFGGTDRPENLVLLNRTVHLMVHAKTKKQFCQLLASYPLTQEQLYMVNQLRYEAHRSHITLDETA